MSLINDALRKARQAAAEHEDQRTTSRASTAYPTRRARPGVGVGALVLVAAAAALGGAAAVWWFSNRPAQPVALLEPAIPTAATATVEPTPPFDAGGRGPGRPGAETPAETGPGAVAATPAQVTPTVVQREADPTPVPPELIGEEESGTSEAVDRIATHSIGDRVFVMDADLGYATLSLGYIVHRPIRPFAEINGVEVYEGSEVEGFTIEKIEIDRVILRDERGPLELRVP